MRALTSSLIVFPLVPLVVAAALLGACSEDAQTHRVFHNLSGATAGAGAAGAGTAGAAGEGTAGAAGTTPTDDGGMTDGGETNDGATSSGCGIEPEINRDKFVLFHLTTIIDTATNAMGD